MSYFYKRDIWKAEKEKALQEKPAEFETYMSLLIQRETNDKNGLKIWRGKAVVPFAHYIFKTPEQREAYINREKGSEERRDQFKAERRAKEEMQKADLKNQIKVGSILYSSWGYDQTNIDFYEVIEKKGEFVWIRELAQNSKSEGWCQDEVTPIPGHFLSESSVMKKRIGPYGLRLKSYSSASLWDGRPKHSTSYA